MLVCMHSSGRAPAQHGNSETVDSQKCRLAGRTGEEQFEND